MAWHCVKRNGYFFPSVWAGGSHCIAPPDEVVSQQVLDGQIDPVIVDQLGQPGTMFDEGHDDLVGVSLALGVFLPDLVRLAGDVHHFRRVEDPPKRQESEGPKVGGLR